MARAALGSLLFLVVAPGVVAGLVPWALTRWERDGDPPSALAPTQRLVIGGLYRHVRNPMYLAVGAIIAGQGLILARPVLGAYLVLFFATVATFVRFHEEPTLTRRFGADYEAYRRAVPGWWPRRQPWSPRDPAA